MLPEQFIRRMENMLGSESRDFFAALEEEKYQALRVNPLKADREDFAARAPFSLSAVPWEKNGYYYEKEDKPGKHPWHEAGVYYIQEPSAMAPVGFLGVRPGEKILDLCAAPGGKTTQIAAAMEGKGILVCNEIHPARARILSENVERMGVVNAIVTNETPDRLAGRFSSWFDRILVDAPCSGEGMFRKNEEACEEWSPENVRLCAQRQDEILEYAWQMLAPGGILCYSTCTFAPQEDEGSISRLLTSHPDLSVLPADMPEGFAPGRPEWIEGGTDPALKEQLERTGRLWPHKLKGEGHFLAVLTKEGCPSPERRTVRRDGEKGLDLRSIPAYTEFAAQFLKAVPGGILLPFGEQLYMAPEETPLLKGLKVLRPGLHLGTVKKNRFEPSHALALALKPDSVKYSLDLPPEGRQIRAYLNGESFPAQGEKGWYLICTGGYSIGWGKLAGGIMKNHYPKGLRKNLPPEDGN